VLISHASDTNVTAEMAEALPGNVRRWFVNHAETYHPMVYPVPVGFRHSERIQADLRKQADKGRPARRNLVYMNHLRDHPAYRRAPHPPEGVRAGIFELFAGRSWVTARDNTLDARLTEAEFYAEIAAHDYMISPPGAGIDCHRHWECLALGTIPIVLSCATTRPLDDMPCLQVARWDEVNPELLEAKLPELRARFDSVAMRKLGFSYWRERIEACISIL
jgi:hypothetical protein